MAPKRGRKVVKTTKVVKETVEVVSILGSQSQEDQAQPEVTERREEQTSVMTKSIPIEDKEEAQDDQETETQEPDFPLDWPKVDKISTPPREEAPPRQEEDEAQDQAQPNNEAQEVKKAAMATTTTTTKTGRKRGRRMRGGMGLGEGGGGGEGYKRYVFRVLKQVHPGMAITSGTMTVINNFMTDMFERLAGEASKLSMYSKKQTMSAREIQGAVKLVLPGELGKHAVAEGSKAVSNYVTYDSKK